ncbi:MAG: hypothetical protein M0Q38_04540 [Bacteroidales bacterium]|jgi:hypothetical protein|nr:hypothetical protein [Bacteroidales bacterium]
MKTNSTFRKVTFRVIVCAAILIVGTMYIQDGYSQIWPVNIDGAPVLKPGQLETTLFFSGSYSLYKGKSETYGYLPGIKIGFGIAKNFDLKLAYSRGFYTFLSKGKWTDSKANNITISPKVSFLKGILGIKVPFTFILYNNDYDKKINVYYTISPRVIVSLHYKQYVEFNMSPFFEVFIPGEGIKPIYSVGGNFGFAFSTNLQRWSVRPEAFLSYPIPNNNIESDIIIFGWGLAATFNFDVFTKKDASSQK